MTTPRLPRYPLQTLLDHAGISQTHLKRALNANSQAIKAAREKGLDPYQADRYAVRFGFHPGEVWDDWL